MNEVFDIEKLDKEELNKTIAIICFNDNFENNFLKILKRNDAKEILDASFSVFITNAPGSFYKIINLPNYDYLFSDLIKLNIRRIIEHLIKQENHRLLFEFIPKYQDLIIENFDVVINNLPYFSDDINIICRKNIFDKGLKKYKDLFISNLIETFEIRNNNKSMDLIYYDNMIAFFHYVSVSSKEKLLEDEDKLIKIFDFILEKVNTGYINDDKNESTLILNQISKLASLSSRFENKIKNNFDFILTLITGKKIQTLEKEQIYDFYVSIINEIMEKENASLRDIRYKKGKNSCVVIIGDKVIKSGNKHTRKIPYHKRLLQPIIRLDIDYISKQMGEYNDKVRLDFFEVYERVDTNNITKDDTYMLFKELLHDNILWTDPNYENVGRLLKKNTPYTYSASNLEEGKDFYVDDASVGFIGDREKEVLDEGELVISDEDCMYLMPNNLMPKMKDILKARPDINVDEFLDNLFIFFHIEYEGLIISGKYLRPYMDRYLNEIKQDYMHDDFSRKM